MKRTELTQNEFTIVDGADFDWLNQYRWYFNRTRKADGGYACRMTSRRNGKQTYKRACTLDQAKMLLKDLSEVALKDT
jgi:hypothetical protein